MSSSVLGRLVRQDKDLEVLGGVTAAGLGEELDGAAQGQVGRSWQHRGASAVGAAETPRWHAEVDANPQLMGLSEYPHPTGEVLVTPVRAPKANAYAERWIRTVRAECLDWLLILGRNHLDQVLRVYVQHYNGHRPHRALGLRAPDSPARPTIPREDHGGTVHRRDLLGGLLHEYRRAA
jgi:hypothetical protein